MFPPGLTPPETGLCLITAEAAAFKVRQEQHAGSERAGENRRQRPRWSQRPVPRSRGGGAVPGRGGGFWMELTLRHPGAPARPCLRLQPPVPGGKAAPRPPRELLVPGRTGLGARTDRGSQRYRIPPPPPCVPPPTLRVPRSAP